MTYGYSLDLRERVLAHRSQGHTLAQTSQVFNISRKTIYNWITLKKEGGDLKMRRTGKRQVVKFEESKLREHIKSHPDAYLSEVASHFKGSASGVCRALKRFRITRKKSRSSIPSETKTKDRRF
jgi:transposase